MTSGQSADSLDPWGLRAGIRDALQQPFFLAFPLAVLLMEGALLAIVILGFRSLNLDAVRAEMAEVRRINEIQSQHLRMAERERAELLGWLKRVEDKIDHLRDARR